MTIHTLGFVFFVSSAFLFGALCGQSLEKENGDTPAVFPFIVAALAFILSLVILISRGLGQ